MISYARLTIESPAMLSEPPTTVLSTKGQLILPKPIRDRLGWDAGTRLVVENTADGVSLRAAPAFTRIEIGQVFACLKTTGPARSIAEMEAGIEAEMARLHARD